MRALLLAGLMGLAAHPALGQSLCGDRAAIVRSLADRFGEARVSGATADQVIVEMFANAETGTWTMLVTSPAGLACIKAAGRNWQRYDDAGDPV